MITVPKRIGVVLVLLMLAVLAAVALWPGPVEVSLAGTPEAMGGRQGTACKWRIRAACRFYLEQGICGGRKEVVASRCRDARRLAEGVDPRYRRELEAVAKASGADTGMLWLGNCLVDVGACRAGCRSAVFSGSALLHGHNLDWDSLGGLVNWSVTVCRRAPADGRFRTVAVGMPGMIGALDIINEHGIALSVNQLGWGRGTMREPSFILLRRVAESCASFAQARAELLKASPEMPFLITLSSAKEGVAAVFEPDAKAGLIRERGLLNGVLAAENARWCGMVQPDSRTFRAANSAQGRSVADLQGLLASPDVMQANNIYSVVFDWKNNRFYLAAGHVPAAAAGYRELVLF